MEVITLGKCFLLGVVVVVLVVVVVIVMLMHDPFFNARRRENEGAAVVDRNQVKPVKINISLTYLKVSRAQLYTHTHF